MTIDLFQSVKSTVPTRKAAEYYGIQVQRNGMCQCPFHDDHNPSMKVDTRYHCFSCQADGDVISFTARLFRLSEKDAAIKLASDFNIALASKSKKQPNEKFRVISNDEMNLHQLSRCFHELADYRNQLVSWKTAYEPKSSGGPFHPLFVASVKELEKVEYQLDVLLSDNASEKQLILEEWNQRKETLKMNNENILPVYRENAAYAREHQELDLFRENHRANLGCKQAIEKAISDNFDGMYLHKDCAKPVLEQYGAERVSLILATTLRSKEWDKRFSRNNRDWAFSFDLPDTKTAYGSDRAFEYVVGSHPAVLDGFVQLVRKEIHEQEKPSIMSSLQAEELVKTAKSHSPTKKSTIER